MACFCDEKFYNFCLYLTENDQEWIWPPDQNEMIWSDFHSFSFFSFDGQVHGLVEEISRVLRRIFTGFVTSIQGFLFCFIFVVLLLAIGLRRSPNLLQIWWSALLVSSKTSPNYFTCMDRSTLTTTSKCFEIYMTFGLCNMLTYQYSNFPFLLWNYTASFLVLELSLLKFRTGSTVPSEWPNQTHTTQDEIIKLVYLPKMNHKITLCTPNQRRPLAQCQGVVWLQHKTRGWEPKTLKNPPYQKL